MQFKYLIYLEYIYRNFLLSFFIKVLNKKGKKMIYEQILFQSFFLLKMKIRDNPYLIFFEVLEKIKPVISIKFKKKVHKNKKKIIVVPIYLNQFQQYRQAVK